MARITEYIGSVLYQSDDSWEQETRDYRENCLLSGNDLTIPQLDLYDDMVKRSKAGGFGVYSLQIAIAGRNLSIPEIAPSGAALDQATILSANIDGMPIYSGTHYAFAAGLIVEDASDYNFVLVSDWPPEATLNILYKQLS